MIPNDDSDRIRGAARIKTYPRAGAPSRSCRIRLRPIWMIGGLVLAFATSGCMGASFKVGASPDQIAADEQACRRKVASDAAYRSCMHERGYTVVDSIERI